MRINVLGPLRVEAGDRVLGARDFGGGKPKQLLEILVAARGRPVPKERLADLLWGERLPRNVAATLETYVSVLRNRLEPGGARDDSAVVTEPGAYRLDTERAEVDLDRFDALVADGRHDAAVALIRGEVLADEPYADWALDLRDRYRSRVVDALLESGEAALARGELMPALARSDAAVAADPLCERAYRLAMRASYGLGRQQDALRSFDRCAKALIDELGVNPMPETEALAAAIARHEDIAVAPPVRPPMIGRAQELAAVLDAAAEGRMVLIEGEAGIGKTRLLDEVTARLADTAVVRVACFELERSLPLVPVIAALQQLGEVPVDDDPFTVMQRLARAGRALVLMVDDLHWADPDTVAALGYAGRRGVTVIGAHRTADIEIDHPLRTLAADRVVLEALTFDELDRAGAGGLHAQTGGHPLFVSRWIESGLPSPVDQRLPATLREAVIARCHLAGSRGFQVLLTASAFDGPFSIERLAAVMSNNEAQVAMALERLVRLRLIDVVGEEYALRYPVVRQALQETLTPGRRLVLSRRVVSA
jgi:DNA-binding SARP family transcriptional activator